jgi:hypothetical protein
VADHTGAGSDGEQGHCERDDHPDRQLHRRGPKHLCPKHGF